jgi:hypothetical protein
MLTAVGSDMVWQSLYWKFVLIDRRKKIESGLRTTSFSFLLNDKRGVIGRMLSSVKPQYRESSFMAGQLGTSTDPGDLTCLNISYVCLVYALITELPAVFVLYDSPLMSGVFIMIIFAVSVWNGGGFYIEVFGRKYVLSPCRTTSAGLLTALADSSANWKPYARSWQKLQLLVLAACRRLQGAHRPPTVTPRLRRTTRPSSLASREPLNLSSSRWTRAQARASPSLRTRRRTDSPGSPILPERRFPFTTPSRPSRTLMPSHSAIHVFMEHSPDYDHSRRTVSIFRLDTAQRRAR